MELKITFDLLPVAGVLLSLLAALVPKFKDWFAKLESAQKQQLMAAILFAGAAGAALLSYFDFLSVYQGSTWQEWVWYPIVDFVVALIANAGTYKATNYTLGPQE